LGKILAGKNFFNAPLKDAAFQQNAPAALETFYPDVRTHSDDLPVIAAARVDFLEPDNITGFDFEAHEIIQRRRGFR
jgi:hypothetical protein